jgi:hypothetical protein
LRPRPASPREQLSAPRPTPLFQGISINGIGTKGRNGEDFLLPALPRPVSSFYFSSPPRLAPPKVVPAQIPRPVSVSDGKSPNRSLRTPTPSSKSDDDEHEQQKETKMMRKKVKYDQQILQIFLQLEQHLLYHHLTVDSTCQ